MQNLTVKTIVKVNSGLRFRIYSVDSTWKVEKYKKLWINEGTIQILWRVLGLENHEYTKNMENLEMQPFGFLVGVGPEIFRIFFKHVEVYVYKISNHSGVVIF